MGRFLVLQWIVPLVCIYICIMLTGHSGLANKKDRKLWKSCVSVLSDFFPPIVKMDHAFHPRTYMLGSGQADRTFGAL